MVSSPLSAVDVRVLGESGLAISWADGHESTLPSSRLRQSCPCATCRDERESLSRRIGVTRTASPAALRLTAAVLTGNYALALVWGDGHRSGIHPFSLLRSQCECLACRLDRGEEST